MNVGLLTETKVWGGTEIHSVRLARGLSERGHTTTLVCLTERTYEVYRAHVQEGLSVVCLAMPKPSEKMSVVDWLRLFAGQPWEICILAKAGIHAGGGCAIDLAARYRFGKYVVLEHLNAPPIGPKTSQWHFGLFPGLGLWWYRRHIERYLRSLGPRKVICVSELNRKQLIGDHRFPQHKVVAIRNGIDVERFRRDPVQAEAWRQRWNVSTEALVFGAIGRFAPAKGYGTAIEAFQRVQRRFPAKDMKLVLVGEGPDEQTLRSHGEGIKPGGNVIFSKFCELPWEPLSAFDVFVMPSLNEGLPLALAEAMACECCPVASAVGGVPEAVSGPELGWLVPPGDVDAFANAMIDAASQTAEQRASIGRRARQHVLENFNAAIQFDLLVDFIESLAPTPPFGPTGENILRSRVRS